MQTVLFRKTLKANKKTTNIFEGPIKILGTELVKILATGGKRKHDFLRQLAKLAKL